MIRVAGLMQQRAAKIHRRDPAGLNPAQQLTAISQRAHRMVAQQSAGVRAVAGKVGRARHPRAPAAGLDAGAGEVSPRPFRPGDPPGAHAAGDAGSRPFARAARTATAPGAVDRGRQGRRGGRGEDRRGARPLAVRPLPQRAGGRGPAIGATGRGDRRARGDALPRLRRGGYGAVPRHPRRRRRHPGRRRQRPVERGRGGGPATEAAGGRAAGGLDQRRSPPDEVARGAHRAARRGDLRRRRHPQRRRPDGDRQSPRLRFAEGPQLAAAAAGGPAGQRGPLADLAGSRRAPLPSLRELRPGDPAPPAGRRRSQRAGHQADALPHQRRLADRAGVGAGRAERQGGDGPGGAQGPLRREPQRDLGPPAGGRRLPRGLRQWPATRPTPRRC